MFTFKKKRPDIRAPDIRKPIATSPPVREPSALLGFIAGDFADDVARLWPSPHSPFLLAEAPRRHLVCLTLGAEQRALDFAGLRAALEGPVRHAVRQLAPSAPQGLTRALSRLGERAWTSADYRLLLARLADPCTAKRLRHAPAIEPRDVRLLSTLPAPVLEAGGARVTLSEDQCALLSECYDALERCIGPESARETARGWAAAPTAEALFRKVSADLSPRELAPPHPGTARLVPLTTRRAVADAGRRYRNCLTDRVLDGWNHHYEWLGQPGGVVCIVEDFIYGWRLDEAMGVANAPLPAPTRAAIEAELKSMGVHVGRSAWELRRLVANAGRPNFAYPAQAETAEDAFGV